MADNRVLDYDPSTASPFQQKIAERVTQGRGRMLTPYKIWIHCPEVAEGMEVIGTYLNTGGSMTTAEVELVILLVAVYWGSPFVIDAHVKHGRRAGLEDAALNDILARKPVTFADERLQTINEMTTLALAKGGAASDAEFGKFEKVLGRRGIAEVLILIGYYTSVALGMRLHNVMPAAG